MVKGRGGEHTKVVWSSLLQTEVRGKTLVEREVHVYGQGLFVHGCYPRNGYIKAVRGGQNQVVTLFTDLLREMGI
jgi:hypothetical protein